MGLSEFRWKVVAPGMVATADTCGELRKLVEVWDVHVCVSCSPMLLGSVGTDFAFT